MTRMIYPKQWLSAHTYDICCDVDREYIAFADSVYDIVEELCPMILKSMRIELAVAITSYLEDKQSRLNLFSSFVAMFRRETGTSHPFEAQFGDVVSPELISAYASDHYDDDSVNSIDLAYLLALRSQLPACAAHLHFEVAEQLMERLTTLGYKRLPSNDDYFETLCDMVELNGYKGLINISLWLLEKSWFLSLVTGIPINPNEHRNASSMYGVSGAGAVAAAIRQRIFSPSCYKLGVRPATFMEEFSRRNELDSKVTEILSDIEFHSLSLFEIMDAKPEKITVRTLSGDILEMSTDGVPANYIRKGYHLTGELVRYGNLWYPLYTPRCLKSEVPQSKKDELWRVQKNLRDGVRHR